LIWTLWRKNAVFRFSFFWDVTRLRLVIIRRRFGTAYRSHFQGPESPRRMLVCPDCPETSVNNYKPVPHNIAERRSYLHRGGSLKSGKKISRFGGMLWIVMYEWMRLLCTGHTALRGEERCGSNYSSHMIVVMGWGKSTSITFKINNEIWMFEHAIVY
jgi:hypothetical protein